jgi:hypothetical protein
MDRHHGTTREAPMPPSRFDCPGCQRPLQTAAPVPDGTNIRCPHCGTVFTRAAPPPVVELVEAQPGPAPARPARQRGQPGANKALVIGLAVWGGLLFLAVGVVLILTLGSSWHDRQLIGRWELIQPPGRFGKNFERTVFDFRGDGTVRLNIIDMQEIGQYHFRDRNTLQIDHDDGRTDTYSVTLTGNELTLSNAGLGQWLRFRRLD